MEQLDNYFVGLSLSEESFDLELLKTESYELNYINDEISNVKLAYGKAFYKSLTETYSYNGMIKNGMKHGLGICLYTSNSKLFESYRGNFLNDEFDGFGILKFQNNDEFHGNFSNGKKNGHGIMYNSNGDIIMDNIWSNDVIFGAIKFVDFYSNTKKIKQIGTLYDSHKIGKWYNIRLDNSIEQIQFYANNEKNIGNILSEIRTNAFGYIDAQIIIKKSLTNDDLLKGLFGYNSDRLMFNNDFVIETIETKNQILKNSNEIINESSNNSTKNLLNKSLKITKSIMYREKISKVVQKIKSQINSPKKQMNSSEINLPKSSEPTESINLINKFDEPVIDSPKKQMNSSEIDSPTSITLLNDENSISHAKVNNETKKSKMKKYKTNTHVIPHTILTNIAIPVDKSKIPNHTFVLYLDSNGKKKSISEYVDGIEYIKIIYINNSDSDPESESENPKLKTISKKSKYTKESTNKANKIIFNQYKMIENKYTFIKTIIYEINSSILPTNISNNKKANKIDKINKIGSIIKCYEGEVNSLFQFHGNGMRYSKGKLKYSGKFENDILLSGKLYAELDDKIYLSYIGTFKNNIPDGEGSFFNHLNKIIYTGNVANGKRDGNGTSFWELTGHKNWEGKWYNDQKHGKGCLYDDTGILICMCTFEHDQMLHME